MGSEALVFSLICVAAGLFVFGLGLLALVRSQLSLGDSVQALECRVAYLEHRRDTLDRYERAWAVVRASANQTKPHPADSDQPVPYRDSPVA
jgi:hypothetical protein